MAAQHLVKKGIRWNVGNGDSIRVWGDKWLPSPSTFRITSPRQLLHVETRVSELISLDVLYPLMWLLGRLRSLMPFSFPMKQS